MTMKITSYGQSDVGRKRKNNEDNFLIDHDLSLFVVADGMGGHAGGEQASMMAVTTMGDVLRTLSTSHDPTLPLGSNDLPEAARMLKYAVKTAGTKIFQKSQSDPMLKGMGTTLTALWLKGNEAHFAQVGDSRGYLIRSGTIQQVTEDHSWVREQVKAGLLSPEDAKLHSYKNIITRSVGFEEDVRIDTYLKDLRPGDCFLLCSDGLTTHVKDDEILGNIVDSPPKETCQRLITLANERGGDDNVTVIFVKIEE